MTFQFSVFFKVLLLKCSFIVLNAWFLKINEPRSV